MCNRRPLLHSIAVAGLLTLCGAAATAGAERQIIRPKGTAPGGNYSPGILTDGTLYIRPGRRRQGRQDPGDVRGRGEAGAGEYPRRARAAGMAPSDVVSAQVYLTDGALFQRFNAVYTAFFKDPRPTRTTVVVAKLVGEGHIEITTTARK